LAALEARIEHVFVDRTLIMEALTHASAAHGRPGGVNYQRLEFFGDRVLGLLVCEQLYARFAGEAESRLAPRYNALVNRAACARAAVRAGLGEAIVMSKSEEQDGGREKEAILADVCEAVLAALYLEGGLEAARAFVLRFWEPDLARSGRAAKDAKTALQEWAAAERHDAPRYDVTARSGPDHAPLFVVQVSVDALSASGEGGSKRDAERAAAAALLKAQGVDV
jgi:ribonuclease-3